MGKKDAPKPPSAQDTAQAQTSTNVGTAVANAFLGNVNQVTPDGSLTYSKSGQHDWFDPYTKQTYKIPTFTATQTLSPEQQEIQRIGLGTERNIAQIGQDQSSRIGTLLGEPVNLNNEATEARLFELGRKRLDPVLAENEDRLRQSLADRGIRLGSTAYDREMRGFGESRNDAYNQLALTGRGQAVQETLTERNQPINEITALLSGSQVQQPNFINPNTATVPTTDVAGIIANNYQNKLAANAQGNQFPGQLAGGLFQLGAGYLAGRA